MTWKVFVFAAALAAAAPALAQQPAPAAGASDHTAALKQALQQGLAKARQYQWIETTIVSLKGEEKSRKQNRCFYGADGSVQKVPVGDAPPAQQADQGGGGRGRRGGHLKERIIENKKDEIQDYMQAAAQLVHAYVPPDPARPSRGRRELAIQ